MTCEAPVLRIGGHGTVLRRRVRAQEADGRTRVFDLTGADVVFRFTSPADDTSIDRAAVVTDAARGLAAYVVVADDFATPGTWRWSVIVESGAGRWESEAQDLEVASGLPDPA